jgi:mRNA interferase RelE/StbE
MMTQTKTRPQRFVWLRILALLAGAVCVGVLVHGVHFVKLQDVETAIGRDLGPGSDENTVRRFMDAHYILYTGYSQEFHRMYGKICRTSIAGITKGRILVQFDFDEKGRMVSHRAVFLHERVARLDDPRSVEEALHGSQLGEFWKYRVGDYRLICQIQDDRLVVLVLRVGHRKKIYR